MPHSGGQWGVHPTGRSPPAHGDPEVVVDAETGIATLTWTIGEYTTAEVVYGASPGALNDAAWLAQFATNHSVALTDLPVNATVYYRIVSTDAAGNRTVGDLQTFISGEVNAAGDWLLYD